MLLASYLYADLSLDSSCRFWNCHLGPDLSSQVCCLEVFSGQVQVPFWDLQRLHVAEKTLPVFMKMRCPFGTFGRCFWGRKWKQKVASEDLSTPPPATREHIWLFPNIILDLGSQMCLSVGFGNLRFLDGWPRNRSPADTEIQLYILMPLKNILQISIKHVLLPRY